MKAVFLDGAFHAPDADVETSLVELLSDDLDRGVGIEEAVADDQSLDLVGADGVGLGARFLAEEGGDPGLLKLFVQLIIPLARQAVFVGGRGRPEAFTLPLDEHEQAGSELVSVGEEKIAGGADDPSFGRLIDQGWCPPVGWPWGWWKGALRAQERIRDVGMDVK